MPCNVSKRVHPGGSLVILCQGQAYTAPGSVGLLRPRTAGGVETG